MELHDKVVDWFREYKSTIGLEANSMRLVLINRRWGKELRRLAPSTKEALELDPRFSFQMNVNGGFDVTVMLSDPDVVRAQREALARDFNACPIAEVGSV